MILTESGESRVNGYLFVLEQSLGRSLPPEVVRDAVREIESHLRERVATADGAPNEREALERSSPSSGRRCASRRPTPRSASSTRRS